MRLKHQYIKHIEIKVFFVAENNTYYLYYDLTYNSCKLNRLLQSNDYFSHNHSVYDA